VKIDPSQTTAKFAGAPDVLTTRGDLMSRDANTYKRIAVGTAGQLISTDGTDPSWVPGLTTRGDLLTRGASAYARLAVGTANQALITNGTDPLWGQVSLSAGVTGTLPIANGGTGQTTAATAALAVAESLSASFSVSKDGSGQTVSTTAPTVVTWPVEIFDVGSHFTSNAWTPPAGTVSMSASVSFANLATLASPTIQINKNGSVFKYVASNNPAAVGGLAAYSVSISIIDQCNGTDSYQVAVSSGDSSYIINGDSSVFFCGTMV